MNFILFRYWLHRLFPTAYRYKKGIVKFSQNSISYFYPKVFLDLKRLSNSRNTKKVQNKLKSNILFYAIRQDQLHVVWDFIIAEALNLRGHNIKVIACDGLISRACNEGWYPRLPKNLCKECFKFARKFYKYAGFKVEFLGDYLSNGSAGNWLGSTELLELLEAERVIEKLNFRDYKNFRYKGLNIGEIVQVSVIHFLRVQDIQTEVEKNLTSRQIYKNFMIGAVLMTDICATIIKRNKPKVIFMLNGKFMAERVMLELAKKENIRTVIFETGLTPDTMVFLHNEPINYSNIGNWNLYKSIPLNEIQEKRLSDYLASRISGEGQTADYWKKLKDGKDTLYNSLKLENFNKTALLFTNIVWDSALFDLTAYFDNPKSWLKSTISFFESHKNIGLIIRIHPAEIFWPGTYRDSLATWIKNTYGNNLPENVRLIKPEDTISSYALMELCDVGIVTTSTTGLEMSVMNKPVIVNDKAHYSNRGFTVDPNNEVEYHQVLTELLIENKQAELDFKLARRYAYYIFFECSLGLNPLILIIIVPYHLI